MKRLFQLRQFKGFTGFIKPRKVYNKFTLASGGPMWGGQGYALATSVASRRPQAVPRHPVACPPAAKMIFWLSSLISDSAGNSAPSPLS